jgi:hypothetical protein
MTVKNSAGALTWEGAVATTVFEYPAEAPALEPGREYSWSVAPRTEGELGEPEIQLHWASLPTVFRVATPDETATVRAEIQQLRQDAKDAPADVHRTVEAMALAQRGFHAAAIARMLPEISRDIVLQKKYFQTLDVALAKREEAARVLLRVLWLDTRQGVLADRITN